jgi:amino acid transporter
MSAGIGLSPNLVLIVSITLWVTSFLCLLNIALALVFRKRSKKEVLSYCVSFIVELSIFVVSLLFYLSVLTTMPFHLPPGLPINQADIAAALAIGIGLFPAGYWHRVNLSDLPERIAQDGKNMKTNGPSIRVNKGSPGEWMN